MVTDPSVSLFHMEGATRSAQRRRMAAADRREAILAAALDVFAHGGYHETSLDAVVRLRGEVAGAIAGLMAVDAPPEWAGKPELEREIEMIAQEITGAVQALANWWDEHRDVPRARILQSVMDFAWIGLERLGEG